MIGTAIEGWADGFPKSNLPASSSENDPALRGTLVVEDLALRVADRSSIAPPDSVEEIRCRGGGNHLAADDIEVTTQLRQCCEPGVCGQHDLLRRHRTACGAHRADLARNDVEDRTPLVDDDATRLSQLTQAEGQLGGMHGSGPCLYNAGIGGR